MDSKKQHWENVFTAKASNNAIWFQKYPKTSIEFLELFNLPLTANIIDIGGGDNNLVDALLEKGYKNIWVLDISSAALQRAQTRLVEKCRLVNWVVRYITGFIPPVKYDFWHDRAAFHFLTGEKEINKYVAIAEAGINNEVYLVLGTFSETGPEKCSGLQVKQYNEASMSARFELAFTRVKCITEKHVTPFNTFQNFLFCSF